MTYTDYAQELNSFSYSITSENCEELLNSKIKERISISRLYYALYHHYMEKYPALASSSSPGKHETLKQMLNKESNTNASRLFGKLKALREWADYRPMSTPPFPLHLTNLHHQVNRTIQSR
jgi:hypothetical protein